MKRQFRLLIFAAIAVLCLQATLLADVTGSILGVAKDATGAVVVGAKITATNQETNQITETKTDGLGEYRLLALPVGQYQVQAALAGFQTVSETGVVLTVNAQRQIDFTFKVGDTKTAVTVEANAVEVETTNTQLGDVIDQKKIMELPLNGRSYIDLLGLQSGVAPVSSRNEGAGTISVNGQRENNNGFLVNGGDVSGGANFEAAIQPNLDSVQEFRLITNSFDAEYGRFSGAIMNTITKSGANQIHGSVFEFLRNDDLDARGFFDGPVKGALKQSQFGYAVGGPAIKNKLFWFTDLQGTKVVNGGSASQTAVLSDSERQGNIGTANLTGNVNGSYWAQILSQRLGTTVTAGEPYSTVFPTGNIPTSAWSPASKNMLQFVPAANVAGTDLYTNPPLSTHTSDYKIGQRADFLTKRFGTWAAYYSADNGSNLNPYGSSSFAIGYGSESKGMNQLGTLSNIYTVSPTAVNEFRLSYARMANRNMPQATSAPSLASLGFVTGAGTLGINNSGPTGYQSIPSINLDNFSFGDPGLNNTFQNTYTMGDNFSKIVGRHTLKFGAEARYYQQNTRSGGSFLGSFNFSGGSETGSDIADFLIGAPSAYTQSSPQVLDARSRYGAAFAQDSMRVTSNFTINFGVRWEFSSPWWDAQNKIVAVIPGEQSTQYPGAPKGLVYPGDPGVPNTLGPTRYNNFAPRLGFAYSPSASSGFLGKLLGGPGKTSIRVGAGLFYTAIQDETNYWNLGTTPFGEYWVSPAPPLFEEPFRTRATGASQGQVFPYVIPTPGSAAAKNFSFAPYLPEVAVTAYKTDNKTPYGIDQNITIQRQLGGNTMLSVGYVGTLGRKLLTMVEANPADPKLCLSLMGAGVMPGTPQCGRFQEDSTFTRPDGTLVHGTRDISGLGSNFGTTFYEANWASSDYNSAQVTLQHHAGNSAFLFAYTWSKSLDDGSFFNDRMNYANHALSRGLSNFDVASNFVGSYTYALPLEKVFHKGPSRLIKGWEFSGITRFSTGLPIQILGAYDQSLTGTSGLDFTNFTGSVQYAGNPRTDGHLWMTTQGFSVPTLGTFGDAPKRFFHGPGFDNWNLGFHKNTQIRENVILQLRGEFFNALNHAQFSNPNGLLTGGSFGRIGSISEPPRIGQVAAKIIF
jgi:hypothetical protein